MTTAHEPPLWAIAASLAARAHAGQVRKDNRTPYVAHPFRVALALRIDFACDDETALAAAILHDVIEDTPLDYDDVAEACGHDVAQIVGALTKDMRLVEDEREPAYDSALAASDWRARLIKLADVLDNLRDIATRDDSPSLPKHIRRCQRAIDLAAHDRPDHPEVERAITTLEAAMRSATACG